MRRPFSDITTLTFTHTKILIEKKHFMAKHLLRKHVFS